MLGPSSRYMGTPLGPKYIPYTYMDPLGSFGVHVLKSAAELTCRPRQ